MSRPLRIEYAGAVYQKDLGTLFPTLHKGPQKQGAHETWGLDFDERLDEYF